MRILLALSVAVIYAHVCILCDQNGVKEPAIYAIIGWIFGIIAGGVIFHDRRQNRLCDH